MRIPRRRWSDGVDLFGTARPAGTPTPHLGDGAIGYTDAVTLSLPQNTFSFEFSAPEFPQPTTIDIVHRSRAGMRIGTCG